MRSRTVNRLLATLVLLAFMPAAFGYTLIEGPAVISFADLSAGREVTIGNTVIHLPGSVRNVLVEKYEYPTNMLEDEVRAFTFQQALFWTAATILLGNSVRSR